MSEPEDPKDDGESSEEAKDAAPADPVEQVVVEPVAAPTELGPIIATPLERPEDVPVAAVEKTGRRRNMIIGGVGAGVLVLVGGFTLYALSLTNEEESEWRRAERESTERSWQRYADWAAEVREGGLRGFWMPRLTAMDERAPTATGRAILARAEAAAARQDWDALCAIVREHPSTPADTRAREALSGRIDRAVAAYRQAATTRNTPADVLGAVAAAMEAAHRGNPCGEGAVIRVVHDVETTGAFSQNVRPGQSVAQILSAVPLEERARAMVEAISGELRAATGGILVPRYAERAETAEGSLNVRIVCAFTPRDAFLTPDGSRLPGVAMSVRVEVSAASQPPPPPPAGQPAPTPTANAAAVYALPPTFAMDVFRSTAGSGDGTVSEVYGRMVELLYPHSGERARQVLGLDRYVAAGTATVGSCANVDPLPANREVRGNTSGDYDNFAGSCFAYGDDDYDQEAAPEHIYRLIVPSRSEVAIALGDGDFGADLYMRSECASGSTEIACESDTGQLVATVDEGVYYVFVDGSEGGEEGPYSVMAAVRPVDEVARACGAATAITAGRDVSASTVGASDNTQGSCAGVGAPERLYTLEAPERSRLRCITTGELARATYLRTDCRDNDSELACVFSSTPEAAPMTAIVERGRHTIGVDGLAFGDRGSFTLRCDLAPTQGMDGTSADACANAGTVPPTGGPIEFDTFLAKDDLAGSCGGTGAPDRVYRLQVTAASQLRVEWAPGFRGVAYVLRESCRPNDQVVCSSGVLNTELAPGTYYLVVDGTSASSFGAGRLNVQLDNLDNICRDAPLLTAGQRTTGDTTGGRFHFRGSCGGDGEDRVFRLNIERRSRVVVRSVQQYDGVLYLRRQCTSTEVACSLRDSSSRTSTIDTVLEPGRYFVFVDARYSSSRGAFDLEAQVSPLDQPP